MGEKTVLIGYKFTDHPHQGTHVLADITLYFLTFIPINNLLDYNVHSTKPYLDSVFENL